MRQLSPKAVWYWRLPLLGQFFLIWTPLALLLGLSQGGASGFLTGGFILLLSFAMTIAWPILRFERFAYQVGEGALQVHQGVIFKQQSAIPLERIQHVETQQGPIERLMGLSRLWVYTASGLRAEADIPGLETEVAMELRDLLSDLGGDGGA